MERLAAEPVSVSPADADALKALRANDSKKFRLVTFWATWCAPCLAEFNEFVAMNRMYRNRDFEMVTVSLNTADEQPKVLDYLKQKQASMHNWIFASTDKDKLIDAFDPTWPGPVPFTVLISPEGKIVYREMGSIDTLALKRAIVAALNEKKPW